MINSIQFMKCRICSNFKYFPFYKYISGAFSYLILLYLSYLRKNGLYFSMNHQVNFGKNCSPLDVLASEVATSTDASTEFSLASENFMRSFLYAASNITFMFIHLQKLSIPECPFPIPFQAVTALKFTSNGLLVFFL